MKEHYIPVSIQSRYYVNNCPEPPEQIWLACHGYGQLAKYFGRHFDVLASKKVKVIVPEGLHRFYLSGTAGRVGASWMTKEDRLTDIDNYLAMLHSIYEKEIKLHTGIPVTLLGFSQGASTISRLAMDERVHFDRLVLWAGVFPPDVPLELGRQRLEGKSFHFIYGTEDEYITLARIEEIKGVLESGDISYKMTSFEGGHTIHTPVLTELATDPY
ncbi:MAG: alpha/beta hydrolase [Cyclobacteriaceae bacterium]